ncbi:hypothetical protein [Paratractidigestivibacter sp.]|uniref:hypothetical protein n=2 Tax=Paratractidigestivibacter sp. TaxID=2847316 RepID=UPI002AC99CFD|nr:hypothetical protein [Paratractidigestivibacter sp.]
MNDGKKGFAAEGSFTSADKTQHVEKTLVDSSAAVIDGKAKWSTAIYFSKMKDTVMSVEMTDTLSTPVTANSKSDKVTVTDLVAKAGVVTLKAGIDYSFAVDGNNRLNNSFKITFAVAAIKKYRGNTDVPVTYTTATANYGTCTYANTATVLNTSSGASHDITGNVPDVLKKAGTATCDATTNSYVVELAVYFNANNSNPTS